jgi:photosystem II stability/assembly factor-like uncharacterized protein
VGVRRLWGSVALVLVTACGSGSLGGSSADTDARDESSEATGDDRTIEASPDSDLEAVSDATADATADVPTGPMVDAMADEPAPSMLDATVDDGTDGSSAWSDGSDDAAQGAGLDSTVDSSVVDGAVDAGAESSAPDAGVEGGIDARPGIDAALDAPTDSTIDVSVDAPVGVDAPAFASFPASGSPGTVLAPVKVIVQRGGQLDTSFTGSITLSFSDSTVPSSAKLGGTLTVAAVAGVATFTDLTIDHPGVFTLVAISTGVGAAYSSPISIEGSAWHPADGAITGGALGPVVVDPTNPDFAYVGSQGGVFRTSNGTQSGASWTRVGLPGLRASSLAIDPLAHQTVYAIAGYRLYRSTDAGNTWLHLTEPFTNAGIFAVAVDPSSSSTIWLGTNGGLFKSTDGGMTWGTRIAIGTSGAYVTALAVAPSNHQTVYAAVQNQSVYQSTDGGSTWSALPAITDTDGGPLAVSYNGLTVDPSNAGRVFVWMYYTAVGSVQLYEGGAWKTPAGIPAAANYAGFSVAIAPAGQWSWASVVPYGLLRSTDAGSTWTQMTTTLPWNQTAYVGVAPSNSSIAYVETALFSTTEVMYRYVTGTWTDISAGLQAFDVPSVVVAPSDPAVVYFSAREYGGYRSADHATTWSAPSALSGIMDGMTLGVSATSANRVYVGLDGVQYNQGVFAVADTTTANPPTQLLTTGKVEGVAVAPTDDQTVYASAPSGLTRGIAVTTTGGSSWSQPTPDAGAPGTQCNGIAVDPTDAAVAYAGLNGIYKTADHGVSWNPLPSGSPASMTWMAIDPTNSRHLWVANGGLYSSGDGGTTWTNLSSSTGLPRATARAIVIDPHTPTTVYVAFDIAGVYKTTDDGVTWASTGLAGWPLNSIAIDPTTTSTLYVGVQGGGLWKTTTGGI